MIKNSCRFLKISFTRSIMRATFKPFFLGILFTSIIWAASVYYFFYHDSTALLSKQLPANQSNHSVELRKEPTKIIESFINEIKSTKDAKKFGENDLGLVRNKEDQKIREDGYIHHAFNVLVSTRLDYHRSIPDSRHKLCASQSYPHITLNTSVIICFYNEEKHTLIRTVYSVLDRTPPHMLHEVILLNDNSDGDIHEEMEKFALKNFPVKVRLLKTLRREGLIRARIYGAKQASGQVLLFLDSHCEVNQDWMQPLLYQIQLNRTFVVTPIIDMIDPDTFAYTSSPLVRGGFNWGLHFKWDSVPDSLLRTSPDFVKPIASPTMAGGLFAIEREYFFDIGEYDSGMNVWGGENLEISFRIWMCGGRLEIIPCSRVGHIFRRRRPYGNIDGQDSMTYNSLRAAHVWLDDYIEHYFKIRPDAKNVSYGEIGPRKRLRQLLKCQSFEWYLKNVYPELKLPGQEKKISSNALEKIQKKMNYGSRRTYKKKRSYRGTYQIQASGTNLCLQSEKESTTKGSNLLLADCSQIKKQMWSVSERGEFVLANNLCMESPESTSHKPHLSKCHEMGGLQEWKYHDDVDSPIYNMAAGLCLGSTKATYDLSELENKYVIMTLCSQDAASRWVFKKIL